MSTMNWYAGEVPDPVVNDPSKRRRLDAESCSSFQTPTERSVQIDPNALQENLYPTAPEAPDATETVGDGSTVAEEEEE